MENKKVVITGGAGFIGSNLARTLAEHNHCVIIDNLSTGRMENIADAVANGQVEFIEGSIMDLDLLQKTFKGVDYILHQAAIPSVPRSLEDPLATAEVNIMGTLNVLLASRDNGIKKVVYASSSSVYGDTIDLPKNEQMKPNPLSPYAVTKLTGEHYCDVFCRAFGLPTVSLRYFNVYGPKQDPSSQYAAVIPRFMTRIIRGEPPVIFGDGDQTRDFTFVKDVVAANIVAAESGATGVFNIGTENRTSISGLAEMIMQLAGKRLAPVCERERTGDVKHSLADISRARSSLGYEPRYSLRMGLELSLEHLTNMPAS